ncbi:MAG: methyltransferase domain-containing protein [Nitrospira sp.]
MQSEVQSSKSELHRLLRPQAGDHILDAGCGLGFDSLALARLVGDDGYVIGIDSSRTMIREAKRSASAARLPVHYHVGDLQNLSYSARSFDACFTASTFMHVSSPTNALLEIVRVLKCGGRVVALECDWETLVISIDNRKIERKVVRLLRRAIRNPGIAHQLPVVFATAGLRNLGVAAWTVTIFEYEFANQIWQIQQTLERAVKSHIITMAELNELLNALRAASNAGKLFGAATAFAVCGAKCV